VAVQKLAGALANVVEKTFDETYSYPNKQM
jgi:hypothetical protein